MLQAAASIVTAALFRLSYATMNHELPEPSAPNREGEQPSPPVRGPLPTSPDSAAAPPMEGSADALPPLTPEEQMALYEKELKETDWGHQPC